MRASSQMSRRIQSACLLWDTATSVNSLNAQKYLILFPCRQTMEWACCWMTYRYLTFQSALSYYLASAQFMSFVLLTIATWAVSTNPVSQIYQGCVATKLGTVTLNDNQYGALISWTFNVGCGAMQTSTLARRLLAGEDPNTVAEEELPRWVKGGNPPRDLPVLVARRKDEIKLFELPSDVQALPVTCWVTKLLEVMFPLRWYLEENKSLARTESTRILKANLAD